jgi:RNA polymerase sigma-32 factor
MNMTATGSITHDSNLQTRGGLLEDPLTPHPISQFDAEDVELLETKGGNIGARMAPTESKDEQLSPELVTLKEDHDKSLVPEIVPSGKLSEDEVGLEHIDLNLPVMPGGDDLISTDPLTQYLARLRYIEPLPTEEQQALAIRFKENDDMRAAQKLVMTNLRLVVKIAREYQRRWANLLDLIQEGNVGLAEAVKRYDPYRGVKFTSYAQYWIRAMILNYLMNHFQPVKIGSTRAGRKLFYNLKKAREQLRRQGFMATPNLIADMLGVDEAEVVRVSEYLDSPPISIDAKAPGYDKTTYGELIPSQSESPEDAAAQGEINVKLAQTIGLFGQSLDDDRNKAIWHERMIAEDPVSLVVLGDRFGVSKERIRQIEVQIRKRFKTFLIGRHGEDVQFEFIERV